jgi:hypothetical protein
MVFKKMKRIFSAVFLLTVFNTVAIGQLLNAAHLSVSVQKAETPFNGTACGTSPWPWLNQTNAINYDCGGQNIAFNVPAIGTSPCTAVPAVGQAYRPDFINIHVIADMGNTLDVGCNQVGNWMNYTTHNSSAGPFTLSLRASLGDMGSSIWDVYVDNVVQTNIAVTNTGDYGTFQTFTSASFNVSQNADHIIRLQCRTGNNVGSCGDINFFQANQVGAQAIAAISPTSASVNASSCADGTLVATMSAVMSPTMPLFSGAWSESADSNFRITPGTANLVCNGTVPGSPTPYTPIVTATPTNTAIAAKSQVVSVTVQAGTGPMPPQVAINAGFTQLADNFDFSQPLYSNLSSWMDCPTTSGNRQIWHQGYGAGVNGSLPCNINQVVDPTSGKTVLRFTYLKSYDGQSGFTGNNNALGAETYNQVDSISTHDYPSQMYVEARYHIDTTNTLTDNNGGPSGAWWWFLQSRGGTQSDFGLTIECDFGEHYQASGGFLNGACSNHYNGLEVGPSYQSYSTNNLPPGWAPTVSHTYGLLFTSDGATQSYACLFVDNRLQICGPTNPQSGANDQFHNFVWLIFGVAQGGNHPTSFDVNMYYEWIHVFTCASYTTGFCFGSTLFNGTQDGQTLTYWH